MNLFSFFRRHKVWAALLIFLLIAGGIVGFLHTPPVKRYAFNRLQNMLESRYGLELHAGSIRYNLLNLSVSADRLSLDGKDSRWPLERLTADKIHVNVGIRTLLSGSLHFQEIKIINPFLVVRPLPTSQKIQNKGMPPKPMNIRIDRLNLKQGTVEFNDQSIPIQASLTRIRIELRYEKKEKLHRGRISVDKGNVDYQGKIFPIHKIQLPFILGKDFIQLQEFRFEFPFLVFKATGRIEDYQTKPQPELRFSAEVQTEALPDILDFNPNLKGTVNCGGRIYSSPEGIGLKGTLTTQNLNASGVPVSSARAEISYHSARLNIKHLSLQSPWGKLNARGTWFPSPKEPSQVTLSWNRLKLGRVMTRLSLPVRLSAESRGKIQGEWTRLDPSQFRGRLEAEFGSFSTPQKQSDVSGRIIADWEEGEATVHPSRIGFPGGELKIQGRRKSQGQVQAFLNVNIQESSPLASLFLPEWGLSSLKGSLNASSNLQGTLSQPRMELRLESSGMSYGSLPMTSLKAHLNYHHQTLSVEDMLIGAGKGEIRIRGDVDAALPKFRLGDSSRLHLSVRGLSLGPVFRSFLPSFPVEGLLKGKSSLKGALLSPQIGFKLQVSPLKIMDKTIDSLSAEGSYRPEQISLNQLSVIKNKASLSGSGKWKPHAETFSLDLSGNHIHLEDLTFWASGAKSYSGEIDFQLNARGPLFQPEGRLELELKKARAGKMRIGELTLDSQADGENLSAHLFNENKTIQVQAQTSLGNLRRIQTRIEINEFNLGDWLPPEPGPQGPAPPFSTHINAGAEISIPLKKPLSFSGNFHMDSLRFDYREHQLTLPHPVSLSAAEGIVSIQELSISGPQTEIHAGGNFPVSDGSAKGLTLSGKTSLNVLEPFIPHMHLRGNIDLKTSVSGTLPKPELKGNMRLKEGEVGYGGLPYSLEKLDGEIAMYSDTLKLKNFSAVTGEGKITAQGQFQIPGLNRGGGPSDRDRLSIRWKGLTPGPLNRFLPPEYSGKLKGRFSGTATATGDFSDFHSISLEGRVNRFQIKLDPFQMKAQEDIRFSLSEGRFRLESFHLAGGDSSVRVQGSMDFTLPEPQIQSRLRVSLDGGSLSPFVEDVLISGKTILELSIQGPVKNPSLTGTGSFQEGYIQLQTLPFTLNNLQGELAFSESLIEISSMEASANGGPLSLTGKIEYSSFNLDRLRLDLNFRQMQWNYPQGLHSSNRGDLHLRYSGGEGELSGDIRILQGYFERDIYIGTELINQIRLNRIRMRSEMPDFLRRLNLDIQIRTEDPYLIHNNLVELGLTANLVLKGNPVEPRFSGLVRNPFSGEIILGDRHFQVETAQVDFPGDDLLAARVNLTAHTTLTHKYEQLDVRLRVNGPLNDISTSITSFPPRSQGELASLLITGRGVEGIKSETANVIGNQMLLYFTSPLASPVTRRIEDWLQVEEVRIEPIHIATEEDPGARFTFRKGLIGNVDLTYSLDITNTQDQTWILEYDLSRSFTLRAFRKDDGSYGSGLQHRIGLGKPGYLKETDISRRTGTILKKIKFTGNRHFSATGLKEELDLPRPGREFNYAKLQSSVDSLKKFYKRQDYLNAVINPRIYYGKENAVEVNMEIHSGNPVFLHFRGDPVSEDIKKEIVQSWNGRLPETARVSEASRRILNRLKGKGYYQAKVDHRQETFPEEIHHTFRVHKGTLFQIGDFAVEGGEAVAESRIRKTIKGLPVSPSSGLWNLVKNFPQAQKQLEILYEEKGYMQVQIHPPQTDVNEEAQQINITLPVDQGRESQVELLHFEGLEAFTPEFLQKSLSLTPETVFRPSQLAEDLNRLRDLYHSRGFQGVEISADLRYLDNNTGVKLIYSISEGTVHHIQDITISGNRRTPDSVIRRELVFEEGEPVVPSELVESQKNLYDLNIFDLVNIQRKRIPDKPEKEQIQVKVREMPLFYLGYGLRYSSEDKLEGFGKVDFNNLLGRGRNGILYYRQSQREKNLRFSLTHPYFIRLPINTLHSFYFTNEKRTGLNTDEIGYTVEQKLKLPYSFSLSYLYRISQIHTYELDPQGPFPFDITLLLSELSTYLVRDTRSEKLNARTGSFFSLSLSYSPEFLGSDLTYIRLFGQYSHYQPLFSNLTWASNLRVGIGNAFDQFM
ncbi:translocation/assembly module TamB domain-containing protein, partial [bacterium]|nr:translocation/assembly module TamB domain-containing protein [bacterium]